MAAREAGAHWKAGHPAAGLQHAERIVSRRQGEPAEARRGIQVVDEAAEHFNGERVEFRRRPDCNAEARGAQIRGEVSSTLAASRVLPTARPATRARKAASSTGKPSAPRPIICACSSAGLLAGSRPGTAG